MIDVHLVRRLGDFALDAAFEAPGGVTAIFGRSGAGKTSLVKGVAGLIPLDAGHVRVDGADLTTLPAAGRRIGYVFQDARLFPHMTVARNLAYGGTRDRDAVIELLGLAPLLDRRPATLSGGETSRVALGRALMSDPRLLLMDEPLAALDAPRRAEIMAYLERLRDRTGVPILYVSHEVSEVARLARTLVVMEAGRVIRAGPVETLLSDPASVPLVGVREAGAVLSGLVRGYDAEDDLTEVALSQATLTLPGRLGPVGAPVRLRVPAQEVILSRARPEGLSALNVIAARIEAMNEGQGPGVAVLLASGRDRILARITRRSARAMALAPGQEVHAILKATAIAARDVSGGSQ